MPKVVFSPINRKILTRDTKKHKSDNLAETSNFGGQLIKESEIKNIMTPRPSSVKKSVAFDP